MLNAKLFLLCIAAVSIPCQGSQMLKAESGDPIRNAETAKPDAGRKNQMVSGKSDTIHAADHKKDKGNQVFWTIVTGVFVFVIGQSCLKMVIEPVQALKEVFGRVAFGLTHYAHVYTQQESTAPERLDDASETLRTLSSDLHARICVVPLFGLTRIFFGLPTIEAVRDASHNLIGLSNGVTGSEADQLANEIREKLGIRNVWAG